MKNFGNFLVVAILVSLADPICAATRKEAYRGVATSETNSLIYLEHHEVTFDSNRIVHSLTTYTRPNGDKIATMDTDYSRSVQMPTYTFKDDSRAYSEGLAFENGTYVAFYNESGKPRVTKELKEKDIFSCQGWHYFVVENLSRIGSGGLQLKLLFPGKLDTFEFTLNKLEQVDGVLRLRLSISNWFLRLFAPSLELHYDADEKKLLKYSGISNILDERGRTQNVQITYAY